MVKNKNYLATAIGAVILVGVVAVGFYLKLKPSDRIDQVAHYKYRTVVTSDLDRDIKQLELRVETKPQADELSMLAALYYAQSRLTGNLSWIDRGERDSEKISRLDAFE